MKKTGFIIVFILMSALLSGLNQDTKKNLKISIVKGNHWFHSFKIMGLISIKTSPQIAVWIEDENGTLLETIYLTGRMKKIRRTEALPYWAHKSDYFSKQNQFDLVTSASPKGNTEITQSIYSYKKNYRVCAEINNSFDYNDSFPKTHKKDPLYNKTNGQPSLIYKTELIRAGETGHFILKETGYGEANGSTGKLYQDLTKLTTAKEIIQYLGISISE